MADLATPSAAAISTGDPSSTKNTKQAVVKPERPDEEKFKAEEAKAIKAHEAAQKKLNDLNATLHNRPNNKDSPSGKRLEEIKAEQNEIKAKQAGNKSSFTAIQERKKKLDEQVKSRISELNAAKGKLNFKSVEDINREVDRLQKQVDTGTMKLVDEKKALSEITNLNKQKKNFGGFEAQQKQIDDLRAQSTELHQSLNDPERKSLNDRYTALKAEADKIYADNQVARKDQNAIFEQRNNARTIANEAYTALKTIRDEYHGASRAFKKYEQEARRIRNEKYKAEKEQYEAGRRKKAAAERLEEASAPAYQDQILTAEGLIRYFDPSALPAKTETGPGKFAATASRSVDDSALKGMKVVKREEEDYFQGTGGKKGKKGRKGAGATPATPDTKLNLSIGVIDELHKVGVNPPSGQSDIPGIVTKLKEKLEHWRSDQKRQTEENIAKAQKDIDRLEAEGTDAEGSRDAATKPSQANQGINGKVSAEAELQQEKDADADVAKELEKAKIEDATQPEEAS